MTNQNVQNGKNVQNVNSQASNTRAHSSNWTIKTIHQHNKYFVIRELNFIHIYQNHQNLALFIQR